MPRPGNVAITVPEAVAKLAQELVNDSTRNDVMPQDRRWDFYLLIKRSEWSLYGRPVATWEVILDALLREKERRQVLHAEAAKLVNSVGQEKPAKKKGGRHGAL